LKEEGQCNLKITSKEESEEAKDREPEPQELVEESKEVEGLLARFEKIDLGGSDHSSKSYPSSPEDQTQKEDKKNNNSATIQKEAVPVHAGKPSKPSTLASNLPVFLAPDFSKGKKEVPA